MKGLTQLLIRELLEAAEWPFLGPSWPVLSAMLVIREVRPSPSLGLPHLPRTRPPPPRPTPQLQQQVCCTQVLLAHTMPSKASGVCAQNGPFSSLPAHPRFSPVPG